MTQKDVTVCLVQVTQNRMGIMVHGEDTYFRLPGADYNKTCEALLGAKFKLVDRIQEALDAKLAEGEGGND